MTNKAFTVWLTGMTRSGKSTMAHLVRDSLSEMGWPVELLDSGEIRRRYSADLGFSREDIERNLKRLAYECELLNRNGVVAIVAAVSPFRASRDSARAQIGSFVEVFCDATVEQVLDRDVDGLLQRARRNEIQNVAGINAPYEPPPSPEVHLRTGEDSPQECLQTILRTLEQLHHTPGEPAGYTTSEAELIKDRLRDLGYI